MAEATRGWIGRFFPEPLPTSYAERLRASIGVAIGIALTGLIGTALIGPMGTMPLLIAPMGASAVLLFGVTASPLAQPWSIVGGNLVAALVCVASARLIGAPLAAAAVAIGLAFGIMALLRCVHPPSGAVALTAVLGGPHIASLGFGFVLIPVGINSLALVLVALAYNNATGRSYPHHAHQPLHPHPPVVPLLLDPSDLDEVLADYGDALDISRDDLSALVHELVGRAQQRGVAG